MASKAIRDRRRESPRRCEEWRRTILARRGIKLNILQVFLLDLGFALIAVCIFLAHIK